MGAAHAEECPIARLESAREELAQFDDVSRQIRDRDARIAELESMLAEKDHSVIDVSRQLLARDVQIQSLEALVRRKDEELALLRKCFSEKELARCVEEASMQWESEKKSEVGAASEVDEYAGLPLVETSQLENRPVCTPPPEPRTPQASGLSEPPDI